MSKHIDYELENRMRVWHLNSTGGAANTCLTVRDYFAIAVLPSLLEKYDETPNELTLEAYEWADAMMKARVLDNQGEL